MNDWIGSRWRGTELMEDDSAEAIGCWGPWEGLELETASSASDCSWSRCEVELKALLLHGVKPSGEDMAVNLIHRPQSSSRVDVAGWILLSHESDEGRRQEFRVISSWG